MQFRISDTFTDSLARLTGDEQKASKTTAFDLQINPASSGLSFHRIDRTKDKNFWSVRVSRDIRLIVHKTDASLLLCYVDHHDKAYAWAEKRRLETHPRTGAAQLVEIRETVREIEIPTYVEVAPTPAPSCLSGIAREDLLGYGVPDEWVDDVLAASEDTLLAIADRVPAEAAEALLLLATGGKPEMATVASQNSDPFEHPDALRRFRLLEDADELAMALAYPWEKWTVFLHPSQRELVAREFNGPARVSGSAGTGKTIVAIHRAVAMARKDTSCRVLLTTFSPELARSLRQKLSRLVADDSDVRKRITIGVIDDIALQLHQEHIGDAKIAEEEMIREWIAEVRTTLADVTLPVTFLCDEWADVVDAWQIDDWPAYRDIKRLGRKTRLSESQRQSAWKVFDVVREHLAATGTVTPSGIFAKLAASDIQPFDAVVVDECQDISVAGLRFVASLLPDRPNSLFFAGDLGQRIFRTPFSWRSLGVDIRGRSRTLKINYRTSHQIRRQADRLLDGTITDADGNEENRDGTISAFNGPPPQISSFCDETAESDGVAEWIRDRLADGVVAKEIVVIVRSVHQVPRARDAVRKASDLTGTGLATVEIVEMHKAKGLEFRSVAVMACDDDVIPLSKRIAAIGDQADLEDIYNTERHLLYVACTRARDHLLVTGVDPVSEFLEDLTVDR